MNLWTQFKALLPGNPLDIGRVTAINSNGTSTITLPGGGTLSARGTDVEVGQNAFVRAGVIEGVAPDLDAGDIEI